MTDTTWREEYLNETSSYSDTKNTPERGSLEFALKLDICFDED